MGMVIFPSLLHDLKGSFGISKIGGGEDLSKSEDHK